MKGVSEGSQKVVVKRRKSLPSNTEVSSYSQTIALKLLRKRPKFHFVKY